MERYCVIMCGGVGSRFWPFSREAKPKQFLDFFGTGQSLLQMAVERVLPVVPIENVILVTNAAYADTIREQLPGISPEHILLEPARRNTAPCILWAAHHIAQRHPDASFVTLPSDHLILKENAFHEALRRGFDFVEADDRLLTIGITPTSPHTGYGYIQKGADVEGWDGFRKVKSFVEKPDLDMAKVFMESGEFLWNAGIFLWQAKSVIKAFEEHASDMAALFASGCGRYTGAEEKDLIAEIFPKSRSISIDYAIMEKAKNVYVEAADLGWSDLGSWKALHEISPKSADGNVTQNCRAILSDCEGSIVASQGEKVIVATGLKDYIVADTPNALLICPLSEEQKIRQAVNDVRERFGSEYI